jgi:hypothetical protein
VLLTGRLDHEQGASVPATLTPYRGSNGKFREEFAFCAKALCTRGETLLRHADFAAPPMPAQGDHIHGWPVALPSTGCPGRVVTMSVAPAFRARSVGMLTQLSSQAGGGFR